MTAVRGDTVVLDVEGTTGALTQVRDVLFPYARDRLAAFLTGDDPRLPALVEAVRTETGDRGLSPEGALSVLTDWADGDMKAAPLKTVQGWIWAEGYARGELRSHVYPEVPGALRRWRARGVRLHSYSSGSTGAQRDWYRYTPYGDLSGLFQGMYDLESAGPKRAPDSYRALRAALAPAAGPPVFLSDTEEELDAAAAAGWQTVGVRRPGDPRGAATGSHPTVPDLDRLTWVRAQDGHRTASGRQGTPR